ncbi:MAG TPA: S53 family serine peptidase [Terracidiphilus sp.]|nr:S53 family serine peptidase [Terracidiphilus sp.]
MRTRLGSIALQAVAIVALGALGVTAGHAQTFKTHHVRQVEKNGEAPMVGHMQSSQVMNLVITLPLRNQDELNRFLADVYSPDSQNYRHFLTVEQFTQQFGPTQDDYSAVLDFAKTNGLTVTGTSPNRLNVSVRGTVAQIDAAFHVQMNFYKHPTEGRNFYAPDREPTTDLPFALWHVSGMDNYSIPKPAGLDKRPSGSVPNATVGSGPSASFLGSDMRAAYYGSGSLTGAGQTVGLFEFEGTDLADVTTYFTNAGQTNNVPITLDSVDGTSTSCLNAKGCDDTEQSLDITQALGMAPGLSELTVYIGATDAAILNEMATRKSPHTGKLDAQFGCSWAWQPADPSTDDPYFTEMAAQGQNFFVAAGDSGKWPTRRSPFYYPAEDANVTAVGGTDLSTSSAAGPWSAESAWSSGGGGISPDRIAIPSWQVSTANSCSSCSKSYRNAPDVSANANYTFYVCADQKACTANLYGGTSFAAPMWAGYLALANQQSVAGGRGVLGFINSALYTVGNGSSFDTDFHDITSGSNGYSAITGYDLATGWGSPNGAALINALAGGTTSNGSFTLSASGNVSVTAGSNVNETISDTVTGTLGSTVSFTVAGLPSGATYQFNPATLPASGNSSSTLAISTTGSTPTGNYLITVTGDSGGTEETASFTLTVNPQASGDFSLAAGAALSVAQNSSNSEAVTITPSNGFNSSVSLSISFSARGASASLSSSTISGGSGSVTLSVKASKKALTGTFPLTITATGGGQTHTATVSVQVVTAATKH